MLIDTDPEAYELLAKEKSFRAESIDLVPSDNHFSAEVAEARTYPLFYSENDGRNFYYPGCETVRAVEELCKGRAKEAFPGSEHVNVKVSDGTRGNEAAYRAMLSEGDTILSLDLRCGGHLSHGLAANFSGKLYKIVNYGVTPDGFVDYDQARRLALEVKPKMIIAGGSACPAVTRFDRFREIADESGAFLHADISHFAGLVSAGLHQSPFPLADTVMTTTQKTLRGPKGALLFSKKAYERKVDSAVFPGVMAHAPGADLLSKAVALGEVVKPAFKELMRRVVENARALAEALLSKGLLLVTGGTETHLLIADLRPIGIDGRTAQERLQAVSILANKQLIPHDERPPVTGSGIRFGSPCATTRGMGTVEMRDLARIIVHALKGTAPPDALRSEVREMALRFPIP
jgi:glycine hydroxymethyltransferase